MDKNSNKLLTLEGLRGVAALVVIFDHLYLMFYVEIDSNLQAITQDRLPVLITKMLRYFVTGLHDGNFAVWVFWVMSAFVLSAKFFQFTKDTNGAQGEDYIFKSVVKRYPRLVIPVLLSSIFAYILLSTGAMTNITLHDRLGEHTSQGWLLTFYDFNPSLVSAIKTSVWDAFFDFDRDATYNTVLWTMKPEFLGSLFLFSYLSILGNKRVRFVAYLITYVVLHLMEFHWLNAFVAGIAMCDLYINSRVFSMMAKYFNSPLLQLASGLTIIVLIGAPNYQGVFHLFVAVILIALCLASQGYQRFFSSPIPVYLGKISFSLYLIHVPILCSFTGFVYLFLEQHFTYFPSAVIASILTIVVCLLAADLFYKYADHLGIKLGGSLATFVRNSN